MSTGPATESAPIGLFHFGRKMAALSGLRQIMDDIAETIGRPLLGLRAAARLAARRTALGHHISSVILPIPG